MVIQRIVSKSDLFFRIYVYCAVGFPFLYVLYVKCSWFRPYRNIHNLNAQVVLPSFYLPHHPPPAYETIKLEKQ